MKEKLLFKEILGGNKYHSVIFTTFSFNMYYWDIQVVKELRSKGIEHISALIDENCLSEQFELYCNEVGDRKAKGYSLYGYHSDMSFHPKIIYLAGDGNALALVGSGNVTPSGHGRNLEIWIPIAVESENDSAYPLMRDIWAYISSLYLGLGEEAENFISRVEDNCSLLKVDYKLESECQTREGRYLRFFANNVRDTLFNQVSDWIGSDQIEEISIMTPFYDEKANFIKDLNKRFSPNRIRMIFQTDFGALPDPNEIPENVEVYDWKNCRLQFQGKEEKKEKRNFHSKCIVLKGKENSYMLAGSANASIAAMGGKNKKSLNHEAIVAIKAKTVNADLWKEMLIYPGVPSTSLPPKIDIGKKSSSDSKNYIWLKEVSFDFNSVTINYSSQKDNDNFRFVIYSTQNEELVSFDLSVSYGENKATFKVDKWKQLPFYATIESVDAAISNKQFVISSVTMSECDPTPINREFRRRCLEIEDGNIINSGICKFLNDICVNHKYHIKTAGVSNSSEVIRNEDKVDDFESADAYRKDADDSLIASNFRVSQKNRTEYSLLNSILAYLTKMESVAEDERFDEDEDFEDASLSLGKEEKKEAKEKSDKTNNVKTFKEISTSLYNTFKSYIWNQFLSISSADNDSLDIDDLEELNKCFMSILVLGGYMNHFVNVCESTRKKQNCDLSLLYSNFLDNLSVTECVYSIVSLFGLRNIRYSKVEKSQIPSYVKLSYTKLFEISCGLMAVCDVINKDNKDYEDLYIQKPSAVLNLAYACDYSTDSIEDAADFIYNHYVIDMLPNIELDEMEVRNAIAYNLKFLEDDVFEFPNEKANLMDESELLGKILFNKKTGYVVANKFLGSTRRFNPISWAGLYDSNKKLYGLVIYEEPESFYNLIINLFDGEILKGKKIECQ